MKLPKLGFGRTAQTFFISSSPSDPPGYDRQGHTCMAISIERLLAHQSDPFVQLTLGDRARCSPGWMRRAPAPLGMTICPLGPT